MIMTHAEDERGLTCRQSDVKKLEKEKKSKWSSSMHAHEVAKIVLSRGMVGEYGMCLAFL